MLIFKNHLNKIIKDHNQLIKLFHLHNIVNILDNHLNFNNTQHSSKNINKILKNMVKFSNKIDIIKLIPKSILKLLKN